MVTDVDTLAGTDLVFELTRHDFDVCSRNVDTSVEASLVVRISDSATITSVRTDRTVVRTLLTGVTIVRPAERLLSELGGVSEEGVLLLNTVPSFFTLNFSVFPDLVSVVSEVSIGGHELFEGLVLPVERLTQDNNVIAAAEGVTEHRDWLQDDFGHVGDGLVGRAAIIVPFRAFSNTGWALFKGAGFRADIDA